MPALIYLIIAILQATPYVIKLIFEIWNLIRKKPVPEQRVATAKLWDIFVKAKEARFVSSSQAAELERFLKDLKNEA